MRGFKVRDLILIVAIVGGALMLATDSKPAPEDRNRVARIDLETIRLVLDWYREGAGSYPMRGDALTRVDQLIEMQSEPYVRRVVNRDPWGNAYRYASDSRSFVVISLGPNGILDTGYAVGSVTPAGDDLLLASDDATRSLASSR